MSEDEATGTAQAVHAIIGSLRVLVIEDHLPTRTGIVRVLTQANFAASGVGNIAAAKQWLATNAVDVALIDIHLGGESGIDAISQLTRDGVRCIALTVSDERDDVLGAIAAGARGYLLKDDPLPRIISALHEVAQGRSPLSSGVAHHLMNTITPEATEVVLTTREREVLVALAQGFTYGECAESLAIGLGTIQSHVKRLYKKLDVTTKTEACAWAMRHGMVR